MNGAATIYSDEIADTICNELMIGRSLVSICSDEGMPHRATVMRWMEKDEAFATRCARARVAQADFMDDMILDVANASTPETAQADRVKIAAYQWRAMKLSPKKYGDRQQVELSGDVAIKADPMALANLTDVQREQLRSIAASLAAKPERDA